MDPDHAIQIRVAVGSGSVGSMTVLALAEKDMNMANNEIILLVFKQKTYID